MSKALKSKVFLNDAVSVVAYGADPTGVSDSAQAFREAIAASDGIVIVPAGTYYIGYTVEITKSVSIVGGGSTINSGALHITMFSVTSSDVSFERLNLVGAGNSSYNTSGRLISAIGTDNGAGNAPTYIYRLRIKECSFSAAGRAGIYATFVDRVTVERCTFTDIGYSAIGFHSCHRAFVDSCYFKDVTPGSSSNTYGVYFSRTNAADTVRYPSSTYGAVHNSYFENIEWEAIDCHGIDGFIVTGNVIKNCGDTNAAIALVYGDDESSTPILPVTNCRIANNHIYDNNNRAIAMSVMDSVSIVHRNIVIDSNTIESTGRPTASSGLYGGISVASAVNCTVSGNTLTGVSPYGIIVRGLSSDSVSITGNTIERAYSTNNTAPAAIIVERGAAAAGAVMVSGNTLTSRTMSPPDAYQNVYGLRIATSDNGNVRVGPNHFSVAATPNSGVLAKYGSSAFSIANHGTASVSVTSGGASATLAVTLPNTYSGNTTFNATATIKARNGGLGLCIVEVSNSSTSEISIRVYPATGTFGASTTVDVYWQTIGF